MIALLPGRLELSRESGEALTRQLTNQLRALITGGRLSPGQSLPSSRTLARSLHVSRNTVSFAIEQLTAEGYLSTSQGRRPVVVAGASLVSGKAPSRRAENRGIEGLVSGWARNLHHTDWPPIYRARPRAFQPGFADEREFPHDTWGRCLRRAATSALLRPDRSHNHPALQEALLQHLAEHRGIKAMPHQIIVMPSAQAGIALIAKVMIDAGDTAWIESPGYGGALAALQAVGAAVAGVPVDDAGMTIVDRKDLPRIIFITPSHQYPTGRLMPVGRRLELLRFAETAGASIIEDDYDGEFHYEARPVAALQGLTHYERVFYLGTFSKSMFADIRVGYVVAPEDLVSTFELAQRHLGLVVTITMQAALAEFIGSGSYVAHVRRMTRLYRTRRDRLLQALAAEVGDRLAIDVPAGGMQLLARCRTSTNDRALCARLLDAGVMTRPLSSMTFHNTRERGLFLGFAAWNEAEIDAAARVIGRNVC
ncbi:MAG: PLP-dependent aminotransferase family protein [Hyphomicrobiales bacterium]|jgi:GntR family transcriptional regulator / MocR family aminotransferase|nr:PLP-dependent aminotransferase family protein [Hyphomicrobiales bacterium]MBV8324349.1 PLP-dependent aminotransferase family protein [Hyphomicrobiales bacterium]